MSQRTFGDPVLELNHRLGGGPEDVLSLSSEMTDAEAEIELGKLDEAEAEEKAAGILATLRRQGHAI